MAARPRYQLERVSGSPDVEALQDRIVPLLEQLASDRASGDTAASAAATAGGTSYTPASAADWNGDPPSTVAAALDRLAAALGPIA